MKKLQYWYNMHTRSSSCDYSSCCILTPLQFKNFFALTPYMLYNSSIIYKQQVIKLKYLWNVHHGIEEIVDMIRRLE